MMDKIYRTLPEAMIPLMNSKGLTYNPAKFHERNESIDASFGCLTGYADLEEDDPGYPVKHETKYLHSILHAPKEIQQSLLLHPLIQIFIDIKWKKIQQLTWITIIFQVSLACSLRLASLPYFELLPTFSQTQPHLHIMHLTALSACLIIPQN